MQKKLPILRKIIITSITLVTLALFIPTSLHAYEFSIDTCPATDDLFEHMSEQVDDRIQGVTANDASKNLFTTRGNLTSAWVWNPSVWTKNDTPLDFSGMSPWNSNGGYTKAGTLVTPRHIVFANHYALNVGDTVLFVASDNTVVTRTVTAVQRVLSTDISVGKLSSDVPSTIAYYPIVDNETFEAYLNDGYNISEYNALLAYILPMVVFDQEDKALIRDTTKKGLFYHRELRHEPSSTGNRRSFNELLIGGDSGNPSFALIGDIPVLLMTHFTAAYGDSHIYYRQNIQDVIDSMGGEYQLSSIDLSCFNAPIVLEENSSMQLTENASNGTSIGTIGIKYNIENDTPYFTIISGNDDGALGIVTSTGEIIVASSTLITSATFPRTITVQAKENGPGGKASVGNYIVNINVYPYFNNSEYTFNIDELSPVGTTIGDINSFDAENDTLAYSIMSGNDSGIFAINSSTGIITVANSDLLNYETTPSHQLVIKAQESTTPEELSATIKVTSTVNDINYVFSENSYSFEIDELDENNTVVGSVNAVSIDLLDIDSTYYQIIAGNTNGIFSINSSTGQITIADNALLDGNQIYNLVIGASEELNTPVLKSVPVIVKVTYTDRPTLSYQAQATSLVGYSANEGASVLMTFELSAPYTKSIIATLVQTSGAAIVGSDYSLSTDTLTFLPGETSKTVTFNALTDSIAEGDEIVLLNIINDTRVTYGSRKNATIRIALAVPVSGYAWSESLGWFDFSNAEINDTALTGYAYNDNTGWLVLDGVTNTNGALSGYAWSESVGYFDFSGVTVSNGDFSGYAYNDNTGWLLFPDGNVVFPDPPLLTEITSIPIPTNDTTPSYTFNTDEAGTITYGGSCTSTTTTATVGDNTIILNTLTDATYTDCTITVTDVDSESSAPLLLTSFTIDTIAPIAPTLSPTYAGSTTLTGTADADTLITLIAGSTPITCTNSPLTATAGLWTCENPSPVLTGGMTITVRSTDTANNVSPDAVITVSAPSSGGGRYIQRKPTKLTQDTLNKGNADAGNTNTNTKTTTDFYFISEDPTIISKLQALHGSDVVTEEIYKNQCETKQKKPYYRSCELGLGLSTFGLFRDSVLCEGFIVQQANEEDYRFQDFAHRKEITGIAVKMKKVLGKAVTLIPPSEYLNTYTDIGLIDQASWIQPVAETALKYGVISKERTLFEPDRDVTRAEAYAMIMNAVCMATNTNTDWRIGIFDRAKKEGLTIRTWDIFEPNRSILRQELFILASKAADWSEKTGGCDPKPEYCFL